MDDFFEGCLQGLLKNIPLIFLALGLFIYILLLRKEKKIKAKHVLLIIFLIMIMAVAGEIDRNISVYYDGLLEESISAGCGSVSEYVKTYMGDDYKNLVQLRYVTSAIGYCTKPICVMLFWLLIQYDGNKKRNFLCSIPVILNALMFSTSYLTHWCFYFDDENYFFKIHEPYYILYITCAFYCVMILLEIAKEIKKNKLKDAFFIFFLMCSIFGTAILESLFVGGSDFQMLNTAMMASVLFYYLFLQSNVMFETIEENEKKLLETENNLKLSQIKPHFIFNTLTSIIDLCPEGSEAQKALFSFSKYLRINVDTMETVGLIPFTTELSHAKIFLDLEKYSYGERLAVDFKLDVVNFKVPALTLQPIVENSVKYGFKAHKTVKILIKTWETDSEYKITVKDDGPGFSEEYLQNRKPAIEHHVGMENISFRLNEMLGATLEAKNIPEGGAEVTISIPKW